MSLAEFPIKFDSLREAISIAVNESLIHRNQFFYIKFSFEGFYVIDWLGIVYDNEKVISTFYNGQQTL